MTENTKYRDRGEIVVEPDEETGAEAQSPLCELVFEETRVCLRCASHEDAVAAVEKLKQAPVRVEIEPVDDDPPPVDMVGEVDDYDEDTDD